MVAVYEEASDCSGKRIVYPDSKGVLDIKIDASSQIAFTFHAGLGMSGMNMVFCPVTFSFEPSLEGKYLAEYRVNRMRTKCTIGLSQEVAEGTENVNFEFRKPNGDSGFSYCR